jgi:hypothetical protein
VAVASTSRNNRVPAPDETSKEGLESPYDEDKRTELTRIHRFCQMVAPWLQERAAAFDAVHLHGHYAVPGWLTWALRACPACPERSRGERSRRACLSQVEGTHPSASSPQCIIWNPRTWVERRGAD